MSTGGTEQVITATLQRPTILRIQVVHTTIVGTTTDIYAERSFLERAHDRMHAMLGTYETDPQMIVNLERLGWKIASALGARALGKITVMLLHRLTQSR